MTHCSLLEHSRDTTCGHHCLLLTRLECAAAPGSGGCAAMFTASSMAFAIEVNQVTTYSYYLLFGTWPCNRGDGYGSLLTNLLTYYSTKTNLLYP